MIEKDRTAIEEEIIFQLISHSGEARSYVFEAFNKAKNGEYDEADEFMEQAKEAFIKAHNMQTELIQKEASGEHMEVNLLMVHAQDHLMSTMLADKLITNLISMQKEINSLKSQLKDK